MAKWIKKNKTQLYAAYKIFSFKGTHRLKVYGWKKLFYTSGDQKRAGITILTAEKIDYKSKTVARDKVII